MYIYMYTYIYIYITYIYIYVYIYIYYSSNRAPMWLTETHTQIWIRIYRRFIISRGYEHTRTGNWPESGFGSRRGAPFDISRCLGDGATLRSSYAPSLAARCLEKKTRRFVDFFAPPPSCFPGFTRGWPDDWSKQALRIKTIGLIKTFSRVYPKKGEHAPGQ